MRSPRISIVLATHNRRDVLAHTLARLDDLELRGDAEIIVVDNASQEDIAAVTRGRRDVTLLRLKRNRGPCAKAYGVDCARGEVLLFLDDDSYPRAGCLERLLGHFAGDGRLAAAGFTVHLPDGSQECSALPHVFVGCGVGLRARAVHAVGGLDLSFFMQAEEYDLTFRLLQAGWKAEVLPDLQVEHLKTQQARRAERTTYYDVVNNCRIAARYLPQPYFGIYARDWVTRYSRLCDGCGHRQALRRGCGVGVLRGMAERPRFRHWRLSPAVLEQLFGWTYVEERMAALRRGGARAVMLVDYGKNVFAFYRGARRAGLRVLGVAADLPAHKRGGRWAPKYRGVPLLPLDHALRMPADGLVISNTSYVHAARRARELAERAAAPVHNWFPPP